MTKRCGVVSSRFLIDATFEMRTNKYVEICISIDAKIIGERVFM